MAMDRFSKEIEDQVKEQFKTDFEHQRQTEQGLLRDYSHAIDIKGQMEGNLATLQQ